MPFFYQIAVAYTDAKTGDRMVADITARYPTHDSQSDNIAGVLEHIRDNLAKLGKGDATITKGRIDRDLTPADDVATPSKQYWAATGPSCRSWVLKTADNGKPLHLPSKGTMYAPTKARDQSKPALAALPAPDSSSTAASAEKPLPNGWTRVFVYGSLKQGHGNHRLLSRARDIGGAEFLGMDALFGQYGMLDWGAFPALVDRTGRKDAEKDFVVGEVYAVSEATLMALDGLEGHPHFYNRTKVKTHVDEHRVWVYFIPEANAGVGGEMNGAEGSCYMECPIWRPTDEELSFAVDLWAAQNEEEESSAAASSK